MFLVPMDEKKLELRLGPPGDVDEYLSKSTALSLGHSCCVGAKRWFSATVEPKTEALKQQCPPPSLASKNPVVGWPPIRSFRKNLTAISSKQTVDRPNDVSSEKSAKGLFVKINMDGIPIGRKVDLKAYDGYEKLSLVVDELFRGLLAAQRDPIASGNQRQLQKEQAVTGLLDGTGEFTLVYEDDEGDRMLVGDVPWEMFVATAKRLRVLKSSELSTLRLGAINKKRAEC